jgi:hypothetical protein
MKEFPGYYERGGVLSGASYRRPAVVFRAVSLV